jgi:hypothetical protein
MSDMGTALASFLRLSKVLVGEENLPDDLVATHFEQANTALQDSLSALLERFDELLREGKDPTLAVRENIWPDARLGSAAEAILSLWFIGGIRNADGDWDVVSADRYYRALVWDAIGAHPPTLSNGYYGHWKYPPEL